MSTSGYPHYKATLPLLGRTAQLKMVEAASLLFYGREINPYHLLDPLTATRTFSPRTKPNCWPSWPLSISCAVS
eukprot:13993943-Ditylum_brightwellii.AAC.1